MIRILVIEDDDRIREVVRRVLDEAGYETLTAESGTRGLELWERHGADLVITDMRMADLDGLAIVVQIRAKSPRLPAIIMSGDSDSPASIARITPTLGSIQFLQKPFLRAQLLELVTRCLRGDGGAAERLSQRSRRDASGD